MGSAIPSNGHLMRNMMTSVGIGGTTQGCRVLCQSCDGFETQEMTCFGWQNTLAVYINVTWAPSKRNLGKQTMGVEIGLRLLWKSVGIMAWQLARPVIPTVAWSVISLDTQENVWNPPLKPWDQAKKKKAPAAVAQQRWWGASPFSRRGWSSKDKLPYYPIDKGHGSVCFLRWPIFIGLYLPKLVNLWPPS